MSMETSEWLNRFTLIGNTEKRGTAWHYRAADQGDESNHYPGFIPVADVLRRLFNWQAQEKPLFLFNEKKKEYHLVDDRKAIVRSDSPFSGDVLGVFKGGYVPHGYEEWLLEVVAEILGTDLGISSAGLLRKGGVAWVEVSIPDSITTPEGVTFRPNFLAGTSFDGTMATTYKRTSQLTVCDNTMAAALASTGEELKIRHTRYSGLRIADAREALALVTTQADEFAAQVKDLCEITVSDKQFTKYLDIAVPVSEESGRGATMAGTKRDIITQLWNNDSRVNPWKNTAFGVVQADNTYRHHYSIVRGADGGKAERNAQNALMGKTGESDDLVLTNLAKALGRKQLIAA